MQLWEQFLDTLEKDIGKHTVDQWLRCLKVLRFDACNLYLQAADSFQALWFEEHIRQKALAHFKSLSGKPIKIHLSLKTTVTPAQKLPLSSSILQFNPDPLDQDLSYEHFILSDENTLTFQMFAELVHFNIKTGTFDPKPSHPTSLYNPIFLHGEQGSGKTHLLCATTLALKKQNLSSLYVTAETFTEHMIKAIRYNQMTAFRQAYRSCDVLVVDNIEYFANKMATQEEFFHTFNHYHMGGKQLILASTGAPHQLTGIESRLISRFEWGLPLTLTPLPPDKLPLLLLKKLQLYQLLLSREVSTYLLSVFTTPKLLTEALHLLSYKYHLHHKAHLSLDTVKTLTESLLQQALGKNLSPEKILSAIAEVFDLKVEEVLGKGQTKEIVFPRQLAMYLLRHKLHMTYPKIGKVFSKDHSTVMSSVHHIAECIQHKEPKVIHRLEHLEKKLLA